MATATRKTAAKTRAASAKTRTPKAAAPAKKPARTTRPAATPAPSPAPVESSSKKKLVRDSFTIPRAEYAAIDALKKRVAKTGRSVKKSELLRAGLMALLAMDDSALAAAVAAVPAIKTGRPKIKKSAAT